MTPTWSNHMTVSRWRHIKTKSCRLLSTSNVCTSPQPYLELLLTARCLVHYEREEGIMRSFLQMLWKILWGNKTAGPDFEVTVVIDRIHWQQVLMLGGVSMVHLSVRHYKSVVSQMWLSETPDTPGVCHRRCCFYEHKNTADRSADATRREE